VTQNAAISSSKTQLP